MWGFYHPCGDGKEEWTNGPRVQYSTTSNRHNIFPDKGPVSLGITAVCPPTPPAARYTKEDCRNARKKHDYYYYYNDDYIGSNDDYKEVLRPCQHLPSVHDPAPTPSPTSAPTPSPTPVPTLAPPSGCDPSAEKVSIAEGKLGVNDLANTNMTLNDVADGVKLVITANGNYESKPGSVNGLNGQGFATINVKSATVANLSFRFLDASNQPVMMKNFYLSFYDVDTLKDKTIEIYKFCDKDAKMYTHEDHEMDITPSSDGCYTVRAAASGVNEPVSPTTLDERQRKNSFTIAFAQAHGFHVVLEVETSKTKIGGRNFLFSGKSTMCD